MHRLAVSICANSLLVLLACAPETAPAPKSSPKSQSAGSATQTTPASNTPVNNTTPPATDPPFVMRTSTGNAAQAGGSAAMRSGQSSAGQAAAVAGATAPAVPRAGAPTSQAGTGAPSAGNPQCTALSTCCAALTDEDDREDCQEVAERNDAERCMRASEDACQAPGMPNMPTMPTTQGEACMKLSTCCGTLPRPPQQEDCREEAMRADDERCTRQLQRTCPELGPPPREPACVTLQACCPMLTDRALALCRRALQEDEERDCTEAQMELCQ